MKNQEKEIIRKYLTGKSNRKELEQALKLLSDSLDDPQIKKELSDWWDHCCVETGNQISRESLQEIWDKICDYNDFYDDHINYNKQKCKK